MKKILKDDAEMMENIRSEKKDYSIYGDDLLESYRDIVDVKDSFDLQYEVVIPSRNMPDLKIYEVVGQRWDIAAITVELAENPERIRSFINSGRLQRCRLEDNEERLKDLRRQNQLRGTWPDKNTFLFKVSPQAIERLAKLKATESPENPTLEYLLKQRELEEERRKMLDAAQREKEKLNHKGYENVETVKVGVKCKI